MRIVDGRVRLEHRGDLPPTAISLGGTEGNRTGSWKYLEPFYRNLTPPCADRCLTGIDVVAMMRAVAEDRWEAAFEAIGGINPFPAVTGRVCPHPCQQPCNRKAHGGGLNIRAVERQVGDFKLARGLRPPLPPADRTPVRVVGTGPAGLAASVSLRRLGHPVTAIEAADEPGGLLRHGIPAFRLPAEVVRAEVDWVRSLGVEFETGRGMRREDYEGRAPLVLAFGLGRSRALGIPGEDLPGVHDGIPFLAAVRAGEARSLGDRVAVIGGGNTALDVARSLLRLGSRPEILYRRSLREMPAFREEIEEAREEGIPIRFLTAPLGVEAAPGGGLLLSVVEMGLGPPDASGRARPVPRKGSEGVLAVDAVVKALGETLSEDLLPEGVAVAGGAVAVDGRWRTSRPGVWACGDATPTLGNTVGEALRAGRLAAVALHEEVEGVRVPPGHPVVAVPDRDGEIARFKGLNMAYFAREAPVAPPRASAAERTGSFRGIEEGLTAEGARREAARCFQCGTCNECDTCYTFCPDFAIVKRPGGGYAVDLDYCKGCGVCVEECPRMGLHLRRAT